MKLVKTFAVCIVLGAMCFQFAGAQDKPDMKKEVVDTTAMNQIKDQGLNHSKVMDFLSEISDVYGPRLTGSPGLKQAGDWVLNHFKEMGLDNVHFEYYDPIGKSWVLKKYSANVTGNQTFPLISYPKAWSPGVKEKGEIVYLDDSADSTLSSYKGTLSGKFVMIGDPRDIKAHFNPEGTRDADSTLLQMANAPEPEPRGRGNRPGGRNTPADVKRRQWSTWNKWKLAEDEGAAGVLTISGGDGGNVFVQQATVPMMPTDTPATVRKNSYDLDVKHVLPQIQVGAEHYDRLVRMIKKGVHPTLDVDLEVEIGKADSSFDIIAEIPGSDLKDQIVMIGAHFDSWQGGTGATDNGTGDAVCTEALRIIKEAGLKPRRTIRIGLWTGEEQGLLGSAAYVKAHFGERNGTFMDPVTTVTQKPEADKFDVYFNDDNGSGKFRGVYMQANEKVRDIFRAWLAPFKDMGANTLTLLNTGSTDHISYDAVGLPAFQFIQDELEYGTRTHHSTMDLYDRAQEDDLKQGAIIMAAFAYDAAMRDDMIPRKPLPKPASSGSGSK